MRRYFHKKTKDGQLVASKEAMNLWKDDDGRDWDWTFQGTHQKKSCIFQNDHIRRLVLPRWFFNISVSHGISQSQAIMRISILYSIHARCVDGYWVYRSYQPTRVQPCYVQSSIVSPCANGSCLVENNRLRWKIEELVLAAWWLQSSWVPDRQVASQDLGHR